MSRQAEIWSGPFGREYTDRNPQTPHELDAHYDRTFGVSRQALNDEFLATIDRDISILEVGANLGTQLRLLERQGFTNLTGVEIQSYALTRARQFAPHLRFIRGSADQLPFTNHSFDLVFTSGVLIHVPPALLSRVMAEICRCTRRYVWGWEYYAEAFQEVPYRGNEALLWKGNFREMYLRLCPDLELVHERRVPYRDSANVDAMFLLEKKTAR